MNEPTLVALPGIQVMGLSVRTQTSDELSGKDPKIPALWEEFFKEAVPHTPIQADAATPLYGVYTAYESDERGAYTVVAGTEVESFEKIPETFTMISIKEGKYLAFEAEGAMPEVVVETWQRIWEFFGHPSAYQRTFQTDFEKYVSDTKLGIYIGVIEV